MRRIVEGRADPVDGAGHHQPEHTARGPARLAAAHPLHAQGRGFTPAGDLRPGDVLRDVDGPAARVIRVRPAGRAQTVHNIEVDTTHAYYVGHHHRHLDPRPQRMHLGRCGRRVG